MRSNRMNAYVGEFKSTFLSCEKDTEEIVKKLFVTSKPYSEYLKRLMLINTKDCLDDMENQDYLDKIKNTSLGDLHEQGYLRFAPKMDFGENEEVKSYLLFTFDNFAPTEKNPEFRDCNITIDVICHTDMWDIGNYRLRPLKIAGYIDGILSGAKLSGIGELQFLGCGELVINEELSGYSLVFAAVHGSDDFIPEIDD